VCRHETTACRVTRSVASRERSTVYTTLSYVRVVTTTAQVKVPDGNRSATSGGAPESGGESCCCARVFRQHQNQRQRDRRTVPTFSARNETVRTEYFQSRTEYDEKSGRRKGTEYGELFVRFTRGCAQLTLADIACGLKKLGCVCVWLATTSVDDCVWSDGPRRYIYTRSDVAILSPRPGGATAADGARAPWANTRTACWARGRAHPRGSPGRQVSPPGDGERRDVALLHPPSVRVTVVVQQRPEQRRACGRRAERFSTHRASRRPNAAWVLIDQRPSAGAFKRPTTTTTTGHLWSSSPWHPFLRGSAVVMITLGLLRIRFRIVCCPHETRIISSTTMKIFHHQRKRNKMVSTIFCVLFFINSTFVLKNYRHERNLRVFRFIEII